METPVFCDWLTSIYASEDNPQRHGMFVRRGYIPRGRMNAGPYYELTDGKGTFWHVHPENCKPKDES